VKFGFDFHGVLDTHHKLYSALTTALVEAGYEVHVITGHQETPEMTELLRSNGIAWTHWFSIVDYHIALGKYPVSFEGDQPWMEKGPWDSTKAEYCDREGIDLLIDDSPTYGSYFTGETVFLLQKNQRNQEVWMKLARRI